jgi:hypothetical protein
MFDPFADAAPASRLAAPEPMPKPVDEFSRDMDDEHRKPWEPSIVRWPTGKPLPDPRDPFAEYVDETTGEPLT